MTLHEELSTPHSWPPKVTGLRDYQEDAILTAVDQFDRGVKCVFLDAPTGSGKTIIAEGIRKLMAKRQGREVKGVYVCTTKSLQDQVHEDFGHYAKVLKGRSNYLPLNAKHGVDCSDCDAHKNEDDEVVCSYCPEVWACPYRVAKAKAEAAPLAILNTSYWLYSSTYAGAFLEPGLMVVDEGDEIADALCDFAGCEISHKLCERWDIQAPSNVSDVQRFNELLPEWAAGVSNKLKKAAELAKASGDDAESDELMSLSLRVGGIGTDCKNGVRFIMEGVDRRNPRESYPRLTIKAVDAAPVSYHLTDKVGFMMVMSATLLSAEIMAEDLGLEPHEWHYHGIGSPFNPANRPVIALPKAQTLSKRVLDEGIPQPVISAMDAIMTHHSDERVLIHTPSRRLSETICEEIGKLYPRTFMTYAGWNRNEVIERWMASKDGVLVAHSLQRGLDLKGDLCRTQVVFKLSVPNLGSPQVKARLYGGGGTSSTKRGDRWMDLHCAREFVQACGRVVRGPDDYGVTYVMDGKLQWLLKSSPEFVPDWLKESYVVGLNTNRAKRVIEGYKALGGTVVERFN